MIIKEWLQEKPFTLSLSSGFFGFFAHLGVISILEEEGITPYKITGSSAGALIGGLFASGLSSVDMKKIFFSLKKENFYDPIGIGGYLKGKKYRNILKDYIPISTIEDCRFKLSLSTYNLLTRKTEIITSGDLVDAIYASTAVPGMFQPLYKPKGIYLDGGIKDRSSLENTNEKERIFYHHLKSHNIYRIKKAKVPQQENLVTLLIDGLPKVTPNKLYLGKKAYNIAQKHTKIFLKKIYQQ